MRLVAHVDMDAFFAAIEERDHPNLRGRPIAVGADPDGGRGRGVVSTANYAARAYGLHSALPISRAWQLSEVARRQGKPPVAFLPVRMSHYAEVSRRIMALAETSVPTLERASIDEAYLDLTETGSYEAAAACCRSLTAHILANEGLTASVGLGPNKLIAKIASGMRKPAGFTVVQPEQVADFLAPLPVGAIPGIGPKATEHLTREGVIRVGDLLAWPRSRLDHAFGQRGLAWWARIRGMDDDPVVAVRTTKSIGEQDTFDTDTRDVEFLIGFIRERCASLLRTLGEEGFQACRTVVLTVRFADFTTVTRSRTLPRPLSETRQLESEALKLFLPFLDRRENPHGKLIRLVGLRLERLE
ncbi:MAG: DNA polymerase IV [Nitrospiraceae bacterium]